MPHLDYNMYCYVWINFDDEMLISIPCQLWCHLVSAIGQGRSLCILLLGILHMVCMVGQ